jgi:hypothetical protein
MRTYISATARSRRQNLAHGGHHVAALSVKPDSERRVKAGVRDRSDGKATTSEWHRPNSI